MQRLPLAEVILRQPALAILDEATNALDASAEIAVLSAQASSCQRKLRPHLASGAPAMTTGSARQ